MPYNPSLGLSRSLRGWTRWLWTCLLLGLSIQTASSDENSGPLRAAPRPGVPVERLLAPDEVHVYEARLDAGSRWRVTVEQRGIDVVVEAIFADRSAFTINAPTYRLGKESLLLPPSTAEVRLEVRAASTGVGAGRYEILIQQLGDGSPEELKRLTAEAAMTEASRLSFELTTESRHGAIEKYQEALKLWRQLGDQRREARVLLDLGILHSFLGQPRRAVEFYGLALPLLRTLGDRDAVAIALNDLGLSHWRLGDNDKAQALLEETLEIQRTLGNPYGEALAINNLCLRSHSKGELRAALECYGQVLKRLRQQGELKVEAQVLSNLGSVYQNLGEPRLALDHHQRSLALHQEFGARQEEAKTLNNMAVVHRVLGAMQEALTYYGRAFEILRQIEDVRQQAVTLSNMGFAYFTLGENDRAVSYLRQALQLRREAGDRRGESITLNILGRVQTGRGATAVALELHRKALDLRRAVGDRRGEAGTLNLVGQNLLATGEGESALASFDQALEILQEVEDRREFSNALHGKGETLLLLGEPRKASSSLRLALGGRREVGERAAEAMTLYTLALAERRLGQPEAALELIESALEVIESLRTRVSAPDLRASFLGRQRQIYELHVDLLMALHAQQLHAKESQGNFARRALEASERGRARSLLDLLSQAGADLQSGVDPGLRERQNVLLGRLNAKATRRLTLLSRGRAADDLEIHSVTAELDSVEAEIRRRSPRYDELAHPRPLALTEIQRLLDSDTLLLEYALGAQRSFLWMVTTESFAVFELPSRGVIEDAAHRVARRLSTVDRRAGRDEEQAAQALSDLLLGPVASFLDDQRLVVVADGGLHYIPFGVLPLPSLGPHSTEPLITRHEIVHLPSASALGVQRRMYAERVPARRSIAVLADPIFNARDPRISGDPVEASLVFDRLPATRREAAVIAELMPPEETLIALDFDANRALVLEGQLRDYRIVHFATHGVIDARSPELSGLVLSLYDEDGESRDGFVRLRDIYNLELGAELVVLSGCRTALGREVRGEGLVGLTRGFMFAGVPRVVASLWRVEDRATAELMGEFYRAMLKEAAPPAAALRQAQLSILRQKRWRDPYYWGAFVLQGDWR